MIFSGEDEVNYTQLAANIDQVIFSSDKSTAKLEIYPGLSALDLSDLVQSLSAFFGEERVTAPKKNQITVSNLDPHLSAHLSRFGSHNLVLARMKTQGPKSVTLQPKPRVDYDSVMTYFTSPRVNPASAPQPKIGPECSARALAGLSKRERKFLVTMTIGEEYLTYDNRFGAAYAGAKQLPFPEFAQYLHRRHIEQLLELAQKAVLKDKRLLFQGLAALVLAESTERIIPQKKKPLFVNLSTELNPYIQILNLERNLLGRSSERISFNYNSNQP